LRYLAHAYRGDNHGRMAAAAASATAEPLLPNTDLLQRIGKL